ncbi:hypothetical protein ACH5RR_035935 [Cinchona calisaya]|uniref:Uncharacterized protein n=1 Tax=Cinchona calisaya TaxID=153742 RepID=A0ABD2Y1Q6_9GENT
MVRYSGVLGVEEPHQSIPNLVVKLYCGDDTVGELCQRFLGFQNFFMVDADSYIFVTTAGKPKPGDPGNSASTSGSPLHYNAGTDKQATITPARRTSSEPMLVTPADMKS